MQGNPDHGLNAPPAPVIAPKKKVPWGWIAGGCGCLGVVLLGFGGVAAYFAYQKGQEIVGNAKRELGVESFSEVAREMNRAAAAAGGADQAVKNADEALRGGGEGVAPLEPPTPEKVRAYLATPLGREDVEKHLATLRAWKAHPAHENVRAKMEALEKLGQKGNASLAEQIRAARTGFEALRDSGEAMNAFAKFLEDSGGAEAFYAQAIRIDGLLFAASMVAGRAGGSADSSDVASKMHDEREEIAKELEAAAVEMRKMLAAQGGDPHEAIAAGIAMGGPGGVAFRRMPAESFATWKALPEATRTELRSLREEPLFAGPLGAMLSLHGLLLSSYAQIEE